MAVEPCARLLDAADAIGRGGDDVRDQLLLEEAHPADLAPVLRHLPLPDLVRVFRRLRPEQASDVLPELDDATLLQLVQALEEVEVSLILNRMPADHAADIVEELSTEQAEKILDLMQEEKSEDVQQLQTSSIIGVVCAVVVGAIGLVWHSPAFGLVVAASMFTSVNLWGAAGTAIPTLSKRLGFDPAVTAGPFETALQDVLGVTIFLALATALLRWLT